VKSFGTTFSFYFPLSGQLPQVFKLLQSEFYSPYFI